jgi:hypothetical protein
LVISRTRVVANKERRPAPPEFIPHRFLDRRGVILMEWLQYAVAQRLPPLGATFIWFDAVIDAVEMQSRMRFTCRPLQSEFPSVSVRRLVESDESVVIQW